MLSFIPLLLIGIPIGLIIVGGVIVRKRGNPETAEQRYFLFLIWTAVGLLVLVLVNWTFPRLIFSMGVLFIPIIPALAAMILLYSGEWHNLQTKQKKPILFALILLVLLTIVLFLFGNITDDGRTLAMVLQAVMFLSISGFVYVVWKWGSRFPVLFGTTAVLYLIFFNWFEVGSSSLPDDLSPGSLAYTGLLALAYLIIPGFVITIAAMLIMSLFLIHRRACLWFP